MISKIVLSTFFFCIITSQFADVFQFHAYAADWLGKVILGPNDRIGFVRQRKVGSTSLHDYLTETMHLCVSQCDRADEFCR